MDWLYRVEPQLAEDQPVHGDLDLVSNLMDTHKVSLFAGFLNGVIGSIVGFFSSCFFWGYFGKVVINIDIYKNKRIAIALPGL